ncbi:hypothetical protein CC78DRAFT_203589 [Lojkania enalia]|uniref:Uncharacterized protein n=1 Tax=Lojkania enalia TaxID=147567 RepID=A0A9P4KB88_9PLEO|nr:hypothetical protein CC78DRAFT_203589 [Didymosphaeria enalia]
MASPHDMAALRSKQATCEDYHSDESDSDSGVVEESFRRSPAAPGQANVAAKRSHPSDLGAEKPVVVEKERLPVNIDGQSDSGYSSHTAATMSSADSAPSSKSQSPPMAPVNAAPTPASPAIKRRPTIGDDRRSSARESSRKPLARSGSISSRRPPAGDRRSTRTTTTTPECDDPKCTQCGPNTPRGRTRKPELPPLDSGLDVSYSFDQQPQRLNPAPSYPPPSPIYNRQPTHYTQGSTVVQPAQNRQRRSSSANRGMRPLSYHGEPGQHWASGMPIPYPSPPHEPHGPPPSLSAHFTIQQPAMHPYGMVGATPPNGGFYYSPSLSQTSPPYDHPARPTMQSRNSSNFSARRPSSYYGPALVTYDQPNGKAPSARYPDAPKSARQENFPATSTFDTDSSGEESLDEEIHHRARDHRLMPPPPLKEHLKRGPSLRRPDTSQEYALERRMSQSLNLPERPRQRDPKASKVSTAAPSRASSRVRPALSQQPKAVSSYDANRNAEVYIEDSRARRRQSYQGYEKRSELEQKHRASNALPALSRPRRQTNTSTRDHDEEVVDTLRDAEAHMQRTRGSEDPLSERVHRAAKRASRVPSGHSDAGSSRSKSDKASRISQSNRTAITNGGGGGEIRLRVDASTPLSLQFNGDIEGRILQINPTEDGMADIVIGSARGNESAYRSERGSVLSRDRKALVANSRSTEDSSVRSQRSSQGRRAREGERPLVSRRRAMETDYYSR